MPFRPSWESCPQQSSDASANACIVATIVRFGPDFASLYGSVPNEVAHKAASVVDGHGQAIDDPSGRCAKPRHGPVEDGGRFLEHAPPP